MIPMTCSLQKIQYIIFNKHTVEIHCDNPHTHIEQEIDTIDKKNTTHTI